MNMTDLNETTESKITKTDQDFLPNYTKLVMSNFKDKFREYGDIYLLAQEQRFQAHKIILAASSDYFYNMFSKDFKESHQNEITFDLDAESLEIIINYIYTGISEFDNDDVEDVLMAAHLFGLENISEICYDRLYNNMSTDNCIGILKIAEYYSSHDLKKKSEIFIYDNFSSVWYENEILKLDIKDFSNLLRLDDIVIYYEEEIFAIVKNWINYDVINRKMYKYDLMKLVRLHLISPKFIREVIKPFCKDTPEISELIMASYEALLLPEIMDSLPPERNVINAHDETLVVLCQDNAMLHLYQTLPLKNSPLTSYFSSNISAQNCGITNVGHQVVIAGGFPKPNVLWYNLKTRRIVHQVGLPENRQFFNIVGVEHEDEPVYVIGGIINSNMTDSVLLWNESIKNWRDVAPMPTKRVQFGTVVINDKIYVIGGQNENNQPLNSIEVYDTIKNEWSKCTPMTFERISPGVGAIDGNLYALGGRSKTEELSSVERYDSATDKWCLVKSLPKKAIFSKVAVCKNRSLVAISGDKIYQYMQEMDEWLVLTNTLKSVECMDIITVPFTF